LIARYQAGFFNANKQRGHAELVLKKYTNKKTPLKEVFEF